ncbi:choice-of-anchor G family protein, partial [Arthrobacter bussei]
MGAASGAAAAPTDRSEALGKFLGGETLTIDLDSIAEIRGALEQNPSGVPPVGPTANPLSAEVLSSLGVDVGSSLQLFGPGGLIELGAVSQYAQATDNGDALAASGAVNDQGAISVGAPGTPPANAALTLTPLLATLPAANGVVSQLDIDLGALASSASQVQGGPVVRDYAIADATLDLTSPLVAATVSGTVATLQTTVNRVESLLETALGARLNVLNVATAAATVDVEEPDLQSLLPTEFTSTRTPGVVLDLRSGQVSVDVEAVLAANGVDLNDLPPNTPLLSGVFGQYIGQAILLTLSEAVDQVQADLIRTVRSLEVTGTVAVTVDLPLLPDVVVNVALGGTLDDITVSTSGVTGAVLLLLDVNALANLAVDGVLSGTVEPALALVTSTLDAVAVGLPTVVVSPILGIVESVVRIRANVQPEIGDLGTGTATVRAAEVTLLPLTPIATVDLASSTVRGTAFVAPIYDPTITLEPSTVSAGTSTTVTGSGFAPNEQVTVSVPSINGQAGSSVSTTATADGTIDVDLPIPASYPVGLINVVALGAESDVPATAGLTVTAVVYAPSITLDPATVVAGGSTVVTGEGFANGETVTVSIPGAVEGDDPITVQVVTGDDGTFEVALPLPADYPAGPVEISASGPVSDTVATADLTVQAPAVVYDPSITLDPATVVAGGSTVVTGEGFANGETVTVSIPGAVEGDDPITVQVVTGDDGTFEATLPIPAGYPAGPVDVTVVGDISDTPVVEKLTVEAPAVVYDPSITLDPATVVAGGSTVVTGEGFANGETVTVSIPGAVEGDDPILVEVIAGDDGSFEATLPVPADYPAGPVDVTGVGDVSDTPVVEG